MVFEVLILEIFEVIIIFEVSPGSQVTSIELNETGIVEPSIVNLEDVLLTLAPSQAVR